MGVAFHSAMANNKPVFSQWMWVVDYQFDPKFLDSPCLFSVTQVTVN